VAQRMKVLTTLANAHHMAWRATGVQRRCNGV
jgi:hypothetical protein